MSDTKCQSRAHQQDAPKIAILSRNSDLYATRRISEEIRASGGQSEVISPFEVSLVVGGDFRPPKKRSRLTPEEPPFDLVIPRIGASITEIGLAALRQLCLRGCIPLNSPDAIDRSRDKFRCAQELAAAGIPVPRTILGSEDGLCSREIITALGGFPIVAKLLRGTQGIGVMIARTDDELSTLLQTFKAQRAQILFQRFIEESHGSDIRVFIAGGKIIGAMSRSPAIGDFRSNIHRGGSAHKVHLNSEEESAALNAAEALGLHVAGVDLILSKSGPLIIEVNSSPGFEALEKAAGVNAAAAIVKNAFQLIREKNETENRVQKQS